LASGRFPAIEVLDFHMASHEVGFNKPDPDIYRAFEDAVQAWSGEIVFFDDSFANIESARAHGWQAFRIDPDGDPGAQMISRLEELGILHAASPYLN